MVSFHVRQLIDRISHALFGLRFRLLLLVLLACAPLVALTVHTASRERRRAVSQWKEREEKLNQLAQREEADLVGQTRQLLLAVSESSAVRSGNREICQQSLEQVFASYPSYANLGLTDTNGEVVASVLPLIELASQSDRAFVRRVQKTRTFEVGDYLTGQGYRGFYTMPRLAGQQPIRRINHHGRHSGVSRTGICHDHPREHAVADDAIA